MAQKEQCQVCGKDELRSRLVRKLMPFGLPAGENHLLYSSYDSSFWTVDTSTEVGNVSIGLYADKYRPRVSNDGTTVEARGSYTVHSSGTLRSTTATDVSGITDICFNLNVGPYHSQSTNELTVEVGLCKSDGTSQSAEKTWSIRGAHLCWFTIPVADIASPYDSSGIYVYADITIDGTSKWWMDGMTLSNGVKPPMYRPITTGEAKVRDALGFVWKTPILCQECAGERILKPSERYGDFRTAEWIEIQDRIEGL